MSLYAVVDVVVHFDTFRNIDLYHQGVYYIRNSLSLEGQGPNDPDESVVAIPHTHFSRPSSMKSVARYVIAFLV